MNKWVCGVVVSVLSLMIVLPVQATPLTVVNHSFEDISGETTFNEFTFGPLNGWDLYDPGNARTPGLDGGDGPDYYTGTLQPQEIGNTGIYEFFTDGAPDGTRVGIAFNFYDNTVGDGEYGLQQQTSNVLTANTSYTLRVEIGNITSGTDLGSNFYDFGGFPGYRVDLLAIDNLGNVTVLTSDNNTLDGSIPEGDWATSTVSHTTGDSDAELGQFIGIRLVNLNQLDPDNPTADVEVDFDNVRLDAIAIPEPASLILLGLGGMMLMRRRV